MGGDYEKEISDRKIYNPVCDWRNGIFFAGSFSTWIFTLFDVFMWWGMFIHCCGLLNENVKIKISFISQMVLSSVIITVLELITGFIVNIWLKMDIWDYSHLPYNFKGQICLLYSVFWFLISSVAIVLDDFLRYKLFNEEKPRYKIF